MFFIILFKLIMSLTACCVGQCGKPVQDSMLTSYGSDMVSVDLPFVEGYETHCEESSYGYDLEFVTSEAADDPVYAPATGTAYVHDENPESGFGLHVNISLHDGTYIILGHLKEVFVEDGDKVVAGELIGFEGCTGDCSDDRVLMGRHAGNARNSGTYGMSLNTLEFLLQDGEDSSVTKAVETESMECAPFSNHVYSSVLKTVLWHPDASLLKSPSSATLYLLVDGELSPFMSTEAFTSRGYESADVALMSEAERNCLGRGDNILGTSFAVSSGFYPDGVLLRPDGTERVFVMTDGIAMPIDTDETLILAGWGNRPIYDVPQAEFDLNAVKQGSCATYTFCLTATDLLTCGGPGEVWAEDTGRTPEESDQEPETDDD